MSELKPRRWTMVASVILILGANGCSGGGAGEGEVLEASEWPGLDGCVEQLGYEPHGLDPVADLEEVWAILMDDMELNMAYAECSVRLKNLWLLERRANNAEGDGAFAQVFADLTACIEARGVTLASATPAEYADAAAEVYRRYPSFLTIEDPLAPAARFDNSSIFEVFGVSASGPFLEAYGDCQSDEYIAHLYDVPVEEVQGRRNPWWE